MTASAISRHGGSSWRWRLSPGGVLREFLARRRAIETPLFGEGSHDLELIRATRRLVPLLVNDASALQILLCVRAIRHREGAMAEAGVLMGGTARLICEAKLDAKLHLFDVFEGFQLPQNRQPAKLETEVRTHFGGVCGNRASVERLLSPYRGVQFHQGLFPDTTAGLERERFSFVHLDMDLAASTFAALDFFHPRLVAGGILIGDDYHDGALRDVFDRFFAGRPDTVIALPWGQVMVVKQAA